MKLTESGCALHRPQNFQLDYKSSLRTLEKWSHPAISSSLRSNYSIRRRIRETCQELTLSVSSILFRSVSLILFRHSYLDHFWAYFRWINEQVVIDTKLMQARCEVNVTQFTIQKEFFWIQTELVCNALCGMRSAVKAFSVPGRSLNTTLRTSAIWQILIES